MAEGLKELRAFNKAAGSSEDVYQSEITARRAGSVFLNRCRKCFDHASAAHSVHETAGRDAALAFLKVTTRCGCKTACTVLGQGVLPLAEMLGMIQIDPRHDRIALRLDRRASRRHHTSD